VCRSVTWISYVAMSDWLMLAFFVLTLTVFAPCYASVSFVLFRFWCGL